MTSPYYAGISLADLWEQRDDIPKQSWVVDGLIPTGLSLIAAREKSGKSLLTLGSIACPVALGTKALGTLHTKQGVVLYFSLEEALEVIIERTERFFSHPDADWFPPDNLRLILGDSIATWSDQALDDLERYIQEFDDVRMVVVDTLRLLAPLKRTGNPATDYDHEYQVGSRLQQLALKYNVAILAVHHTVKSSYGDIFDSIGGTAWTKAAESMIVLERDGKGLKLHVRGRSVPTTCWSLSCDEETLLWKIDDQVDLSSVRRKKRQSQLDEITVDQVFGLEDRVRYSDIKVSILDHGLSSSSVDRWIERRIADGSIIKLEENQGYERIDATDSTETASPDSISVSAPPSLLPIGIPDDDSGGDEHDHSSGNHHQLPIEENGGGSEESLLQNQSTENTHA